MKNLLYSVKIWFLTRLWPILRLKKVWITLFLIILAIFYFRNNGTVTAKEVKLKASTFVQQVLLTGKVTANSQVSMGFESSGRVSSVNVKVGDTVKKGQTLASIYNGDLLASVQQKRAQLDAENARLAEVLRGSRPEDIAIAKSDVANAQVSVDESLRSLIDEIKDAYAKSDDIVRVKIDQLYRNPTSGYPEVIGFSAPEGDVDLRQSLTDQRILAGERLASWKKSSALISSTNFSDKYTDEARSNLSFMRDYLNDMTIMVVGVQSNTSLSLAVVNQYRTDISNARTTIATELSELINENESYRTAVINLSKAKDQLSLKMIGSTAEQIATARAQVKSAEATLANAYALVNKSVIAAPFDGLITKVDLDPGEITSPNTPVIDLMGGGQYQIECFVSESDIAKIKIGQSAVVTLDAYGKDQKFEASVVGVDPSETVVDGVSAYKTQFIFTSSDDRIKSGMSANVTVKTDEKNSAIVIPQEALYLLNGEKTVNVIADGKVISKRVVTGGLDADGNLLVVSGLNVGDVIEIK